MVVSRPRANFLSLPTELRLQIAADALDQHILSGLRHLDSPSGHDFKLQLDMEYRPSANLSIRLVCRQFNIDFARVAFHKTRFVLHSNAAARITAQSEALLKDVKRLLMGYPHDTIADWGEFPFNTKCLQPDELVMAMPLSKDAEFAAVVTMLRRLRNVRKVGLLLQGDVHLAKLRCYRLIGAMLKEDHYQRYDAPGAPRLESTWWSWSFNSDFSWATFVAQEPRPVMGEQEYMVLIKPTIDEIMEQTASALS